MSTKIYFPILLALRQATNLANPCSFHIRSCAGDSPACVTGGGVKAGEVKPSSTWLVTYELHRKRQLETVNANTKITLAFAIPHNTEMQVTSFFEPGKPTVCKKASVTPILSIRM